MSLAFKNRLNPRLGKRERLAVGAGVANFDFTNGILTNFTIPVSSDGKLGQRLAEGAVLQVTGADSVYYTYDGSAPAAGVGFTAYPGDYIYLSSFQEIRNFKATRVATDTSIEALAMFPA